MREFLNRFVLMFLTSIGLAVGLACSGGGGGGSTSTPTVVAPSGLTYSSNTVTYVTGIAITPNTPSVGGGAVVSYSVAPALPVGLNLNTGTGVITGTPSAVTATAAYTVSATNTGGSTTAILNITVRLLMGGAIQSGALSLTAAVTTFAGTATISGSTDATGTAASFQQPYGITTDGSSLYVADGANRTVRKIVIASGAVTTFAGAAGSAGTTDGTGGAARFTFPSGITTDGTNLYVTDPAYNTVRKIVIASAVVTTIAGTPGPAGSLDGTGAAARFNTPQGITTDGTNLYVADTYNHTVRKIVIATGVVTTLAGTATVSGTADGTGSLARFQSPTGITTDGTNLYVADTDNSLVRKIVIATGVVTTLAGTVGFPGSTDGLGTAASFNNPYAITCDGANLYVADTFNNTVRKIVIASGLVTTLAGSSGTTGATNGTGAAASFNYPRGATTDGNSLYVVEAFNHTVRKIQ